MPLTSTEIAIAYRLILERNPSEAEIANAASQHANLAALRQTFMSSEEFYRKFLRMRADFEARQHPILVHPQIPETASAALLDLLDTAEALQPSEQVDTKGLAGLRARSRPERRKLRHVRGDLAVDAGEALDLPYRRLCILRRPGPRLYRLYRTACDQAAAETADHDPGAASDAGVRDGDGADMSFGTYLDYSLHSLPHRLELDNGQVRRLAGGQTAAKLGQEARLLQAALHNALAPGVILGLAERPEPLLQELAEQGFIDLPEADVTDDTPEDDLDAALAGLTAEQRVIFDAYIAWDTYLYEVCDALLFPPTD